MYKAGEGFKQQGVAYAVADLLPPLSQSVTLWLTPLPLQA